LEDPIISMAARHFGRHRFVLALTLALGCGEPRGVRHESDDAGSSEWDAEQPQLVDAANDPDAGRSARPDANDLAIEPPLQPPAGGCGVVRTIELPSNDKVVRVPGGFVVGPAPTLGEAINRVSWLAISEDGRRRKQQTGGSSEQLSLALLPMGNDPFAGRAVNVTRSGGDDRVAAESIAEGSIGVPHDVGAAFFRGTIQKTAAVSLDGLRAVYVTGHVAVDNPHAFVIDEHGSRVGEVVTLSVHEHPSFTCLQALPTAHGAVVSVVDTERSVPALRLIEVDAQATALQDITWDLTGTVGCPIVQLAEHGLWVTVPAAANAFDLLSVEAGQVTVRESGLALAPRWIGETDDGELLCLTPDESGKARIARKDPGNSWVFVAGELPNMTVVAAEPGRLFGTSWSATLATQQLYEIACDRWPSLSLAE
jgi:hypothetical protein